MRCFPHMSVFDNIAFGMKIRGLSKSEIGTQVRNVADRLRIDLSSTGDPRPFLEGSASESRLLGRWFGVRAFF